MLDPLPATVVLCGGFGTRLRSVVSDRPKVLAPVAGRPFLAHLLEHLADEGVSDVVLSAGHLAGQIEAFALRAAPAGVRIRVVTEGEPLGTAGALRFAAQAAELQGVFHAVNGDTYFTGSLRKLRDEHSRRRAALTIALVRVGDAERYGTVRFDAESGRVTSFEEKGRSGPGWINAGAYTLSRDLLEHVSAGLPTSLERDIMPGLVGHGLFAVAYDDALFLDIGTPADYARAEAVLKTASTP